MGYSITSIVCAIFSYLLATTIYNLFFHPVAKVPGPFLARISLWPSFYHAYKGDRHIWIWQQFERYGPRFRAGPNIVLFRTPGAQNDIYNHKANVRRSSFYDALVRHKDDRNTLNSTNIALHARKRRSLDLAFTEQSIRAASPIVAKHIDRWNDRLLGETDDEGWSMPTDMATWSDRLVFDVLGDLCFGKAFDTKEPGDNPLKIIQHQIAESMKFLYILSKSPWLDSLIWLKPRGLDKLLEAITPQNMKDYHSFVEQSVRERLDKEQEAQTKAPVREDMFHFLCSAKDPSTGQSVFSTADLLSEASLLIIAGSDTTATTICGLFFYLTHNAHVYDELVAEVRSSFSSLDEIVYGTKLYSCKYLLACVNESLRMVPPAPSELPRVIQKGGQTIDGNFYPEGTVVGTAEWASGRNKEIYGDPDTFRPERWIHSERNSQENVLCIKRAFYPFSKGPANCAGQNLALLELYMVVARTLWRMDVRLAPGKSVGEGRLDLGWGRRDPRQYQVIDAYISFREGPILQFRERVS
ncbi:benzoate 4-monooxygenase cytochrome P450 [Periconia macrospinosa]|uniref:Benzoate 4-monooxygenase cytochrome P450 n=1 Tax=Periconia macrospinosa TaxID=97972 RepID=A0A2V1DGF2_9PLEO|nr:benzoate 4-monooxygenase cytochrome P450 [Periconia macrospinosa]